jgi:hypothetical protein
MPESHFDGALGGAEEREDALISLVSVNIGSISDFSQSVTDVARGARIPGCISLRPCGLRVPPPASE